MEAVGVGVGVGVDASIRALFPKEPLLRLGILSAEQAISAARQRLLGSSTPGDGFVANATPSVNFEREALLYAAKLPISALSHTPPYPSTLSLGIRLRDSTSSAPLPQEDVELQPVYMLMRKVFHPLASEWGGVSSLSTSTTTTTTTTSETPSALLFSVRGGVSPTLWEDFVWRSSSSSPAPPVGAGMDHKLHSHRLFALPNPHPADIHTLGLSFTVDISSAVPLPFQPLFPSLIRPTSASGASIFTLPPSSLTPSDNATLAAAYAATTASLSGAYVFQALLTLPLVSRGAPRGGGSPGRPGHGLTLRLWRDASEWVSAERAAEAAGVVRGRSVLGGAFPLLSHSLVLPTLGSPAVICTTGGCSDVTERGGCLERPGGALFHRDFWGYIASSTTAASPRVATLTGYVTPPRPPQATLTHTVSFVLLCDSPCALEIEGVVVASVSQPLLQTPSSGSLDAPGRGTSLTPPQVQALAQCLFTDDHGAKTGPPDGSTLTAVVTEPLPLRGGSPYSIRALLRVDDTREGGRKAGERGVLALAWELGQSSQEDSRSQGASPCGAATLVPTSAFSWGVEEIQGSPLPVWVE